jgi:hypothetical protein
MSVYCKRCKVNWAKPWSQSVEGSDESYDHCPICYTDAYLTDGKPGSTYVKCAITGEITNTKTGKVFHHTWEKKKRKQRRKVWLETDQEFNERREKWQDEWLENKDLFGGSKKIERIARKFEYVEIEL